MFLFSKRTYNEVGYQIVFIGENKNVSLSQQNAKLQIQEQKLKATDSDQIISIKIYNSLQSLIPTLSIVYEDKGFSLTSYLKQQNTIFKLAIIRDQNSQLQNVWILNNYKILTSSPSSIRYQLFFDNQIALNLFRVCHVATSKSVNTQQQQKESPYQLAKKLLKLSEIQMYPIIYDGNGGQIKNRYSIPYCNNYVSYITDANTPVIDSMTHLFALGSSDGELPPVYFIYNLKDKKCFISTFENLLKRQHIQQQPPSTQWPFSFIQLYNLGKYHQIKNLQQIHEMNKIGGVNTAKLLFNYQYFDFNHLSRQWNTNKVSKNTLISTLQHGAGESLFNESYTSTNYQKIYSFPAHNERTTYDVLKNLQLYSSCIKFEVDGDLNLDVGHVITIAEGSSKTDKLLNGYWIITRVIHTFYQQNYRTVMECARTMKMQG